MLSNVLQRRQQVAQSACSTEARARLGALELIGAGISELPEIHTISCPGFLHASSIPAQLLANHRYASHVFHLLLLIPYMMINN